MLNQIKTFFREHLTPGADETAAAEQHRLQLAVAALLLEMTQMDGEVRPEQCARVQSAISEHFGLSQDETRSLVELAEAERNDATDYFQFTSLINAAYAAEQKERIIEQLWAVALADDALHRYEEHLVRKIALLLHVPHPAFIAAKHRISGGSGA
ncbi:Tellurite resistance protein [Thiorhodovibrio winogradskyi]|uniref:Tellurite resistance protein n=1 Tax=Thiorhodovibrio winogradskyi TaxID=77007 RepID=A0ABZ0SC85_9GAMM|nr:TerB family tellurite resistance protein [Thiorhodovibrio winogradskyi]